MRKSAIEQRLRMAVHGLPQELKQIFSQGLEDEPVASAPGHWTSSATERLHLVKPGRSAPRPRASLPAQTFDHLQELAEIAPAAAREMRREIDRRLVWVRRAQAARVAWSGRKPWPWPLLLALRKARTTTVAAGLLVTVLEWAEADRDDIVKLARVIRSTDERTAQIVLTTIMDLDLSHARFEA